MTIDHFAAWITEWLFAATWQLALFILLVAIATSALRNAAPRLRYKLWLLVLIKALAPTSLAAVWAIGAWGVAPAQQRMPPDAAEFFNAAVSVETVARPPALPTRQPALAQSGSLPTKEVTRSRRRLARLAIAGIWTTGVIAFGVMVVFGYRRLRRAVAELPVVDEGPTRVALEKAALAVRLQSAGRVTLRLANRPTSPFLIGVARPTIVAPADLVARLTPDELQGVLAHELMHWKRRDTWVGWLQTVVQALFWFHPLVWWSAARLREERERACDDDVLRLRASDSAAYGEAIVRSLTIGQGRPAGLNSTEGQTAKPPFAAAGLVGVFERGASLQQRVESIMNFDPTRGRFGWASAAALTAFALVFIPMAGQGWAQGSAADEEIVTLSLDRHEPSATRIELDAETKIEGNASVRVTTKWPTTVCLAEVERPDVDGAQLIYSAQVKAELDGAASLEMWAHLDGGQFFSRNPAVAVRGAGDWKRLEIPFFFQPGQRPDKVTLNLMVQGRGTVWVDDIRLLKRALPTGFRSAAKPENEAVKQPTPYPVVVETIPKRGAINVDPAIDQIIVKFDRAMTVGNHSWTGGGENFPTIDESRQVEWIDDRTCALPVRLRSASMYRVGINATSHQNFKSADGKPAAHTAVYFTTREANRSLQRRVKAPAVAKMTPENGASDVDPTLTRIRVTFDSPMSAGMSWVKTDGAWPGATDERAEWSKDGRTCWLPANLKPGVTYTLSLNGSHYANFQSKWGVPLEPVVWTFTTRDE